MRPVVNELEHANTYPEELIEQMKQMGVYGLAIPEPYGDFAVSARCYALVTEEIARGWMSLAGAFGGHSVVSKLILRFGTEEQRQRYLPRMATGELRTTMALTEPDGGSDLQALRTVARPVADGYVINGSKTWITNARTAGLVALLCKTDPSAQPAHTQASRSCSSRRSRASPSHAICRSSATRASSRASCTSTTVTCRATPCSAASRARASAR